MSELVTRQTDTKQFKNRRVGLALALIIALYIAAVIAFIIVY